MGDPVILIVDDEEAGANLLRRRLIRVGFQVHLCTDSMKVADILAGASIDERVDAMLVDHNMPGKNGLEVIQETRKTYTAVELPILMITAMNEVNYLVQALEAGANDYISKPVDVQIATARLRAHLDMTRLHRELTKKKEIEALNALIVTYNHEINNPLAIAIGLVEQANELSGGTLKQLSTVLEALGRIVTITKKITNATRNGVETESYVQSEQMLKIT